MTRSPSAEVDPVALEVQWQRLISIMDEVDNATVKTSFSTIVGESRDFACILVDQEGVSLCQSSFSPPNFCVVLPRTSKVMLERFPLETLREGDVLVTNDPWYGTGHLPDYIVLTPVFHGGRPVAFMGSVAHLADVGGHPGDIEASDVFTEGVRVPPAKLYEAGEENRLLFDVIGQNCRVPDLVLGDLRAIAGTHRVGARRLREFLDDYEMDDLVGLSADVHGRSERLMRERIAALPDGSYEFGLDIDGYVDIVHLHATVTIDGDDIFVDYAGTSPGRARRDQLHLQHHVRLDVLPVQVRARAVIPNNEGLFRPVTVTAPEGCILNTTFPHPVQARAKTTNNINQVLFGALWPVLGEHAQAGAGSIWPFSVHGDTEEHGRFSVHILPHGGRGAMRDMDGLVPIAFPHNSSVTPIEIFESQSPVRILRKTFRPDSAGPGRSRGGPGQTMIFENAGEHTIHARVRPDKIVCAPPGLDGGRNGRTGEVWFNGVQIHRFPILDFAPGDRIELRMPGGAGFGPVERRPKERSSRTSVAASSAGGRHPRLRPGGRATTAGRRRREGATDEEPRPHQSGGDVAEARGHRRRDRHGHHPHLLLDDRRREPRLRLHLDGCPGRGLSQAQWSPPQFCTMLPRTTRDMLKRFPQETLREGDVLATNDPWIGSTHLPDYNLVSPVFHHGELVAFLGTVAHVSDVGGHLGDLEASDMFMEGTRLMPNLFYRGGEVDPVIEEFIAANCRVPEMVLGDLHAIVGTHRVGTRRIREFMDDYGLENITELSEAIQAKSEAALRDAIRALPDGVTDYEITADGYLEPFTLKAALEVRGDTLASTSPVPRRSSGTPPSTPRSTSATRPRSTRSRPCWPRTSRTTTDWSGPSRSRRPRARS